MVSPCLFETTPVPEQTGLLSPGSLGGWAIGAETVTGVNFPKADKRGMV